ncbi:ECF transporter S component [Brachyspira innocens]|uniref:ECF transporter S component n=1 Tax=Brachyspira innocens TaxID=13264 RepID=A0ABT8YZQ8_9SPIR|nr:ECF transporter S component [Brachyspira innocens]MDO6993271.1 ECF transporter S component [Brachyspira innocens]MDO7021371.1 ECF transporter S component [Brachyspira innocens]
MVSRLKYNILIMFIGIAANFALTFLVLLLKIPFLFMDSIGTILTAVILGPIYGAFVGIMTNIITSITIDYINLHFAIVNVLIGLMAGLIAKKYDFTKISVSFISGIVIGIVSGVISSPISIVLANGVSTGTVDTYIKALINSGKSLAVSTTIGTLSAALIDKIVSSLLVTIAIKKIYFFRINK